MIRLVRLDLTQEGIGPFDYAPLTTAAELRADVALGVNAKHPTQ